VVDGRVQGSRTVPEDSCEIQFLKSNPYVTVGTAAAAFYCPVLVMCFLYGRIYCETERRRIGLARLQAHRQSSNGGDHGSAGTGATPGGGPSGAMAEESSDGDVRISQCELFLFFIRHERSQQSNAKNS
jgi:7 transmembrane receptor (rhodopsin family)